VRDTRQERGKKDLRQNEEFIKLNELRRWQASVKPR